MLWFGRTKFEDIFGFKPTGVPRLKDIEQGRVDTVLSRLAQQLDSCFQSEEYFWREAQGIPQVGFGQLLNESKNKIRHATEAAAKKKKEFWTAHNAAKKAGYQLREKYSAYLHIQ